MEWQHSLHWRVLVFYSGKQRVAGEGGVSMARMTVRAQRMSLLLLGALGKI